jgi:hypothetical protein
VGGCLVRQSENVSKAAYSEKRKDIIKIDNKNRLSKLGPMAPFSLSTLLRHTAPVLEICTCRFPL